MLFITLSVIIGLACSVVSIKTLTGYTPMKRIYKVLTGIVIVAGWFAPFIVVFVRRRKWLDADVFFLVFPRGVLPVRDMLFIVVPDIGSRLGLVHGL